MPDVGDPAPDFSLLSTNGEITLSKALQHSRVLLAFYFEDGTPACATEVRALKDANGMLREAGTKIIAVSADSVASHRAFARRLGGVPFVMASDGLLDAARAFDVVAEDDRRRARRAIFVIEQDGSIAFAANPFQVNNLSQLEDALRAAGVAV
jgi:thioredoxin-dependent peroxiredoxin